MPPEIPCPSRAGLIGFVYLVTNKANGKVYVGQTQVSLSRRWVQHVSASKKGSSYALHRAIRKYGKDNFTISLLQEVRGVYSDLLASEILQIAAHNCISPNGYNLSQGGEGVDFSSPSVKAKHLEAVRQVTSRISWREAQFRGALKRLSDSDWCQHNSEALARMHADSKWRENHLAALKRLHASPDWRPKQAAGIARRSSSLSWQKNHREAMQKMHSDPEFKQGVNDRIRVLNARRTAEALARDALCSPEEAFQRAHRRSLQRIRYAKSKGL